MDSMPQYEANARKGGASGEVTIRKSLVAGLAELGVAVDVAQSDADFDRLAANIDSTCVCVWPSVLAPAPAPAFPHRRPFHPQVRLGRPRRVDVGS